MYSQFVVLAVMVAAPGPKADPRDPASLEGDWVITKYVVGGKEQDTPKEHEVRIGDGKLVIAGGEEEFTITTDKKSDPAQIDLTSSRKKGELIKGIYRLDNGTVTLCFPKGGQGDRPTKFESVVGTQVVLLTLDRARKKD